MTGGSDSFPLRLALPGARSAGGAGSEPALDRIAGFVARLLGTRYAQVSLIVGDTQVIAGSYGLGLEPGAGTEPAEESLCTVTMRSGAPLRVSDARSDQRVCLLPPVASGTVGAYLGVPLAGDDGRLVGAVCAFDREPREWSDADVVLLEQLAATATAELSIAAAAGRVRASDARLELAFSVAGIGSFDWDIATNEINWDDRLKEIFGLDPAVDEFDLDTFFGRLHEQDRERVRAALERAVETRGSYEAEYRVTVPGGGLRWIFARGQVLTDANGEAVRMLGAAYDTTSLRTAREQVARVLETMSSAFFSLDREWRITYVNREGERVLGVSRAELVGRVLWEAFPEALGTPFEEHYRRAVESGEPVRFESYYPPLDGWFEVRAWPGADGLAVYFDDISARRASEDEQARQRERAEQATARLEILARAGARLAESLNAWRVLEVLGKVCVPELGDWVAVGVAADVAAQLHGIEDPADTRQVEVVHVSAARPQMRGDLVALFDQLPISVDDPYGLGRVVATGESEWLPTVSDDVLAAFVNEDVPLERLRALGVESAITVPMTSRNRVLGAFAVAKPRSGNFDRTLLEELGARAGAALDNALLYAGTRRVGLALQRSLLPRRLPRVPGLSVATRYLPGVEGIEVGGDFHLAQTVSDGRVLLAIGDVMGRGVQAAATMGQLRSVLATLAYGGDSPQRILDRLAALVDELVELQMATSLVTLYDPRTGRLEVASAGHPPPLLAPPGGEPSYLELEPGPPLGAGAAEHPCAMVHLVPGTTVLLYTDGLVETRTQSLADGMERLRAAMASADGMTPERVADHLLRETGRGAGTDDDVALLVARHRDGG